MEAMPDKIQHVERKAGIEKEQQHTVHNLFPDRNPAVQKIQPHENVNCHAAVEVRPMVESRLHLYISDVPRDHVKDREVDFQCGRKIKIARRRTLQRRNLRKKHRSRQRTRQKRIHTKQEKAVQTIFPSRPFLQKQERHIVNHHEEAYHN